MQKHAEKPKKKLKSSNNPTSLRISVVIPTYNRAHTLLRALNSVLAQTRLPNEIFVIDDGSTDNTLGILKPFIEAKKVIYLKTPNRGVSHARNRGIARATGEWVAFLDSDDEWLADKLQKQIDFIKQNPAIEIVHGEEIWIRKGKRVNPKKKHQKFGGDIFLKCLPLCLISPSAVMIKKDLFAKVGTFREDYPVCEDYDLWLRITAQFEVGFIDEPIIKKYGGHDDQLSHKFKAMDYWRAKSLFEVYQAPTLCDQKRTAVREELERKCDILLKGYQKYPNAAHEAQVKAFIA